MVLGRTQFAAENCDDNGNYRRNTTKHRRREEHRQRPHRRTATGGWSKVRAVNYGCGKSSYPENKCREYAQLATNNELRRGTEETCEKQVDHELDGP
jgi:hypothetical protein